jgi:hypothetical protein
MSQVCKSKDIIGLFWPCVAADWMRRDADLVIFIFVTPLFCPRLASSLLAIFFWAHLASPVPRSHNPLPNNATFATLASHSKRASSCTPSVLSTSLSPQIFEGSLGYSVGKAF